MCEAETVQLIDDEQAKHGYGRWIIPKPFAQQAYDQPELYGTVAQQIYRCKALGPDGEMLRCMQEIVSNQVARVFSQLTLCQHRNDTENECLRDDVGKDSADDFEERERAFEEKAYFKDQVDAMLA